MILAGFIYLTGHQRSVSQGLFQARCLQMTFPRSGIASLLLARLAELHRWQGPGHDFEQTLLYSERLDVIFFTVVLLKDISILPIHPQSDFLGYTLDDYGSSISSLFLSFARFGCDSANTLPVLLWSWLQELLRTGMAFPSHI